MKKKITLILLFALLALVAWVYFSPRIRVDLAARQHDPAKMKLFHSEIMNKSYARLPNDFECGLVHLSDGSAVKYWFINRHVQPGLGLTRFDFPDEETVYLRGVFCCEVWLDGEAMSGKASLLAYIAKWDGTSP
jgi:hypothetical protein